MICPYCGASVQQDARFCGECGKPLAVPLTVAMPAAAPVRPSSGRLVQPQSPSAARAAAPPGLEDSAATTMRRVVNAGGAPTAGRPVTAPTPAVASSPAPAAAPPAAATPAVSAAAAPAASVAAPAAEAAPVRASAFMDAVESPVARVLRIVLLLVLDAGLIGVGTYYLYQFIRLSPAAAAPSITIGQPSLVRGQEAGRLGPAPAVAAAPPAPVEGAAAGEPARPAAVAAARPAKGGKAPAPPPAPAFGGARPAGGGRPVAAAPPAAARPVPAPAAAARAPAAPAAAPAPAPAPPAPAAARDDDPGEVEAQIDAESVRIIMRQHKADVRACYNQGLKANPDASGTIEVRFAIDAQGRAVRRRVITDTLGLPGVGDCIVGQLGRWQFPRPVGGEVEFVYPFILSPGR